jgi:phospholipid/cholesterol/gamma-HCH transport system ATP-binding protein
MMNLTSTLPFLNNDELSLDTGDIRLSKIIKKYNGMTIINKLDLEVKQGEKIAIIGPSGCGKSTLLRVIMGLHSPDRGRVYLGSHEVTALNIKQIRLLRRKIGMLFQSAALFDSLTVSENVAFPLIETLGVKDLKLVKRRVKEVLELVEMPDAGHKMPSELSGGQRKRIGLARAIVGDPKIVLYDEPTTGLDPVLSTAIEDLIVKLNQQLGVTSVVVTHQLTTMFRTADRILMMNNGVLLDAKTPQELHDARGDTYANFIHGIPAERETI